MGNRQKFKTLSKCQNRRYPKAGPRIWVASFTLLVTLGNPSEWSAASAGTPAPFDYRSYLEGINGPLGMDDLEYGLDYADDKEKQLLQEFDFDPTKTVQMLIEYAIKTNTTPEQFMEDMQDLILLQNRSRTEVKIEIPPVESSVPVFPRMVPEPFIPQQFQQSSARDSWRPELKRLEKKYRVNSESTDPDAPTMARIMLMFPHFLNLGQKPFSGHSDICSRNGYCLPSFFHYPEFGGLLPLEGAPNDTVRLAIFTVHLRALQLGKEEKEDSVPFRTKCSLVKRRMEKSLLSDERRWRFLQNNDVITANNELTVNIENNYDEITKEFKERVVIPNARRQQHSSLFHEKRPSDFTDGDGF